jgi:hypothetical protein
MRALSASELLTVWEQGQGEPIFRRAHLLLSAACPERSPEELAKISIGSRDARLLTLREWTFGRRLTGIIACPACGQRLEIMVNVDDVRATASDSVREEFDLEWNEYYVTFRLPNTVDLGEASFSENRENMRAALIRQCILKARRDDGDIAADQLPAPVIEAVVSRMTEHDPQADMHLALSCPGCGHRWQALFDIVSFFWSEIHVWALRLLREVHILATAYGWRESDLLAMSPLRRQAYLSMVGV